MTTLPQTTIRVPRPAAPNQLIIPSAPGGAIAPPAASQMSGADIFRVIRGNIWLIVVAVTVMGGVGYVFNKYLATYYSRYTVTGLLQVQPESSRSALIKGDQPERFGNVSMEQKTQAQLMRTPALLARLLQNENSDIRKTTWYEYVKSNPEQAKQELLKNWSVTPVAESKLIKLELTWSNPKEAKLILEELVEEHLRYQQKLGRDDQAEETRQLNILRQTYNFKWREESDKCHNYVVQLSLDGIGISGRISSLDTQLHTLSNQVLALQLNAQNAKNTYENLKRNVEAGVDSPKIEEAVINHPEVLRAKDALNRAEAFLGELERLGPGHQMLVTATKRCAAARENLDRVTTELRLRYRTTMFDEAQVQVAETQQALDAMNIRVRELKQKLGELTNQMADYLTHKDLEKAYAEKLNQVKNRIELINNTPSLKDLSGVAWATKPEAPGSPSFPKLSLTMAMALMLGLGVSLGIAFLREMLDQTVRSPRDIARVGQMNLLGMVPHEDDDPQATGARLPLVIFEAPHSIMAEQLRQVRTRLQHTTSLDTTRSILITGPTPGDGRTTMACNLAAGLALNGRRILLVDANFRRPELHRVFDFNNDKGFSDVLNNVEIFDQAVHESQVPNLAVMSTGPKPTNATELLESQLLIDFIEKALEEFDHVIFDSGPMLFVSESVALAPRVDGVITVVRARSSSRGLLQRMRDGLRQLKAEHIGVVLNGVRSQGGGYYGKNIKAYYAYQDASAYAERT